MRATDIPVKDLVADIQNGKLRLPAMQRRYVWTAPRVRDLLDSLYRGYPSGAILVWETDKEMPTRDFAVAQATNPFATQMLLLDGQQRCTSLSSVIRGEPVSVRGRKRPIEILFNVDHPDDVPLEATEVDEDDTDDDDDAGSGDDDGLTIQERLKQRTFVVANKSLTGDKRWIRVSDIFNENKGDADLLENLVESMRDPNFRKYTSRLQRVRQIRNYAYRMHVLEQDLSYEEVAEIFVRVNSLGVKLRGSDLALALITSRWRESLALFEAFQERCENDTWYSLDMGLIVRSLVVFATNQSRFKTASTIPLQKLKASWEDAKRGLDFAINFLRANAGIEDESLLSSPLFLVALAYYGMAKKLTISADEERLLRRWLYVANMRGHYSRGSSESILDADLNIIKAGGGAQELLGALLQQFGRLDAAPEDFVGRSQRSPLFATTYLALKAAGAKDWRTQLALSLAHKNKEHYIEFHHVHPKSLLKSAGYDTAAINEIANMAFVSGFKNREIAATPAEEYLANLVQQQGAESLTAHCVPLEPDLWKVDNYPDFLKARRIALAKLVNEFLEQDRGKGAAVDIEAIIAAGENDSTEFKSSARWDHREGGINKGVEGAIVKTVAGFLNSKGGTLLIGIADDGSVLGIAEDMSTLGGRPDRDGFQQFLTNLLQSRVGKVATSASMSISFHIARGKEICMVRVTAGSEPIYVIDGTKRFYVRMQNTTHELDVEQTARYVRGRW